MAELTTENKQLTERTDNKNEHADVVPPIIVSLGKKKKKQIKQLKRGKGSAMNEVMDVVDQVQAYLGDDAANKIIVPVVIIYKKKQRRSTGWF